MPQHIVSANSEIPAPAKVAYGIIADYRVGHPAILPKPPFVGLEVEKGGTGAGTIIRVKVRLMGLPGVFRAAVSEPEPGRIIAETDLKNGRLTSFIVDPIGSDRCRVTIQTISAISRRPAGKIQGYFIERILRPMFEEELKLLAKVACVGKANPPSSAK